MNLNNISKNTLSTIWLDFISYVFFPFYILVISIETINIFDVNKLLASILILYLIYIAFIFVKQIKRNKIAYYLMYSFYPLSIITIVLYFCNKFSILKITYVLELIGVGVLIWVIPNYIYLYKRKELFRKHNVAHIKKCPGCNRIIPVSMISCGKCSYKEELNNE